MIHLSEIRIYPVKSLRGLSPRSAVVEPWGLQQDRRWMLVDSTGRFISQREFPALARVDAAAEGGALRIAAEGQGALELRVPDETVPSEPVTVWRSTVAARPAGDAAAAWFSRLLGVACRLVYLADPTLRRVSPEYGRAEDRVSFADGYPLLLASLPSLAALNRRLPTAPLPIDRFRPNLVVDGCAPFEEDSWRLIRVGEVTFRLVKPCDRCIVTTVDQRSGERAIDAARAEPLRTLARFRRSGNKILFGQNLIPSSLGELRIGDPVEVLERGPPPVFGAEGAGAAVEGT